MNAVKKETSMNRATVNKATLVGHVGADPEVRQTPSGKTVASFIATNDNWRRQDGRQLHRDQRQLA